MSLTVSEANAEISRLVTEGADRWAVAAARERRAAAERKEERRQLASLVARLDLSRMQRRGVRLTPDELRLLLDELYLLKGTVVLTAGVSP